MKNINTSQSIYFYDDRNKYDCMYRLKTILYQDSDTCICMAECTSLDENLPDEKFIFNPVTGGVLNSDFYSWHATNDIEWVQSKFDDWTEGREVKNKDAY